MRQLEFNFKPRDATPEEHRKWIEEELIPLGEKQLPFIAFMEVLPVATVGFVLVDFWIIGKHL